MSQRPRNTSSPSDSKWADAANSIEKNEAGYQSWQDVDQEPEDYNSSDWLTRKTKKVQNDSLNSTQRALSRVNEAHSVAQSNLSRLAEQSGNLLLKIIWQIS